MLMIKRTKTLHYNWSDKHIEYMRRTQHSAMNIAEGSIRSGKTTDNIFCFAHDLKRSRDKLHLATASTQPTAKLIIGDCDGYGLEHIFRGQCKWGKYKGNECLKICGKDTNYQEKIVLFCGGAKADSYKKFRGMSIGLWIATEINLHHADTIREAQRRQINADIKRFYWDLNPESPNAEIYQEFIDVYTKKDKDGELKGGFNLVTFNIFDNVNLSQDNLDAEISKYEKDSVFYKRDILGKRCAAEGVIYRQFADKPDRFFATSAPEIMFATIGVDFGGNQSAHAFVCNGYTKGFQEVITLDEVYIKEKISPERLNNEFIQFVRKCLVHYPVYDVFCDSAETTLIQGLKAAAFADKLPVNIHNAKKRRITDRIRFYNTIMAQGRYKIAPHCEHVIDALCSAVWDDKKLEDTRLDDGSLNVDSLDALEYATERYMRDIIKIGGILH